MANSQVKQARVPWGAAKESILMLVWGYVSKIQSWVLRVCRDVVVDGSVKGEV